MIPVTGISPHGDRRNGATLCPACKIEPTRSSFVRLSVKSGRFVRSGQYTPGELFWILKNGLKMTGMPNWADHGDDELWATVAFLEQLSGLSESDYARLIQVNIMQGMPHHMDDPAPAGAPHQH